MFCVHLSQNWYAVQLLPGWDLFDGRYDQLIAHSHSFDKYQLNINGNKNLIRNHMIYNIIKQLHYIYCYQVVGSCLP